MKVLITGGAGYIGSVLTKKTLQRGYSVRVVDWLRWADESSLAFPTDSRFEFIRGDLRDDRVQGVVLEGVDAVIHLAAIVGDPACKKEPDLAEEVNWLAAKSIFNKANKMGVERFIFASTCSNYGKMPDLDRYIDETGVLNPVSWYAKLKVKFEEYLLNTPVGSMAAASLRFATAYGVSRRMRFDLTVNEFVKEAVLGRELVVYGKEFWRPYCHVEDLAQGCICALEADKKLIDREVFNVGDSGENYQKRMIVDLIRKRIPQVKVRFVHKDEDSRDYKVNFNKIKDKMNFRISKTLEDGIDEIIQLLRGGLLKDADSTCYRNV
jgi:nucleoside-diphosphate-sugar epimerase